MPPEPLPFRQVRRRLLSAGFVSAGARCRHVKFVRADTDGVRTVIVPRHHEIAAGTIRSIIRQAGLTVTEFDRLP